MTNKQTITINGKKYDAHTGLLVGPSAPKISHSRLNKSAVASPSVHTKAQRSHTLKRNLVNKKAPVRPVDSMVRMKKSVAKSPHISRFAPHPVVKQTATSSTQHSSPSDVIAVKHPKLTKAHHAHASAKYNARPQKTTAPTPSQVIMRQTTDAALTAPSHKAKKTKRSLKSRFPRVFSVASASLAVLILGGYLTYINMPTLSIRVAAAGAGIDASYPAYQPDGYRLSGPIAYSDGQVSIKFVANAGSQNFTLKETESSWDSSAVLDSYVEPQTNGEYVVYNENGLTIYTYDGDAAWVNGGILYTIQGDAPLSNEQIRQIATSL